MVYPAGLGSCWPAGPRDFGLRWADLALDQTAMLATSRLRPPPSRCQNACAAPTRFAQQLSRPGAKRRMFPSSLVTSDVFELATTLAATFLPGEENGHPHLDVVRGPDNTFMRPLGLWKARSTIRDKEARSKSTTHGRSKGRWGMGYVHCATTARPGHGGGISQGREQLYYISTSSASTTIIPPRLVTGALSRQSSS